MLSPPVRPRSLPRVNAVLGRAGRAIDRQLSRAHEQEAPVLWYDELSAEVVAVPAPERPPVPTSLCTLESLRQQARSRAQVDLTRAAGAGQRIPENVVDVQAAMELDLALVTGRPVGEARGVTFSTQGLVVASLGMLRRTLCRALSSTEKISAALRRALSRAHAQKVKSGKMRGRAAHDGCTTDLRPSPPCAHHEDLHLADFQARQRSWRPHFGRDIDEGASAGVALQNLLDGLSVPLGFARGSPAWHAVGTLCRVLFSPCPSAFFAFVRGELFRLETASVQDLVPIPVAPVEPPEEPGPTEVPPTLPGATRAAVHALAPPTGPHAPPT